MSKTSTTESIKNPFTNLSYEEARRQLVDVVDKLESGGASLAESLKLWEQGEMLAAVCQEWLNGAKAKVAAAQDQTQNLNET